MAGGIQEDDGRGIGNVDGRSGRTGRRGVAEELSRSSDTTLMGMCL